MQIGSESFPMLQIGNESSYALERWLVYFRKIPLRLSMFRNSIYGHSWYNIYIRSLLSSFESFQAVPSESNRYHVYIFLLKKDEGRSWTDKCSTDPSESGFSSLKGFFSSQKDPSESGFISETTSQDTDVTRDPWTDEGCIHGEGRWNSDARSLS